LRYPDGCFAIQRSLFEIERPEDFESWYCWKCYPAINAQIVIDYKYRICSYDLRSGSANDKSVRNYSSFGKNFHTMVPKGKYVIADAGYTLTQYMKIPFPITEPMPADERFFNYLHSSTRIAVERAIVMLQNQFRILKLPLNQKTNSITGSSGTTQMVKIVQACFVLHNIFLSLNDSLNDTAESDFEDSEEHVKSKEMNCNSAITMNPFSIYERILSLRQAIISVLALSESCGFFEAPKTPHGVIGLPAVARRFAVIALLGT
jgi:hypothetical protein